MSDRPRCRHCVECLAVRPRDLCSTCYYDPKIRRMYPRRPGGTGGDDITEAELDAMIAERLPTMPREPRDEVRETLPAAVARGIGVRYTVVRRRSVLDERDNLG